MGSRKTYYYDDQTCSFVEHRPTPKEVIKRAFYYLAGSSLLAFVGVTLYFQINDDPRYVQLQRENSNLKKEIKAFSKTVASLEESVDVLHKRDNDFYRSMLNEKPVEEGVWNGGVGGSVSDPAQPQDLREATQRLEQLRSKVKVQEESFEQLHSLLSDKRGELAHIPAIKPVPGRIISGFGVRTHPIYRIKKVHTGLDIEAKIGTPVYAAGDGVVKFAGVRSNGYGTHIDVDHGYGFETKYAHLSRLNVKMGQKVKRGDLIGYTGNSGLSKGPHLHYEILKNGEKIDPIDYFYMDQTPGEYLELRRQAAVENESMD
jgi:murein DD-endopeptidase MepM/ murein hydrolase activator NlpD